MSNIDGSQWWASIEGLTIRVGEDGNEVLRGDELDPLPYVWQRVYEQNIDTFLYWLERQLPGYTITLSGEVLGTFLCMEAITMDDVSVSIIDMLIEYLER